jgi:UDP-N-acetylmuramoyl-tripeptide--D-alanyl-D-alanine ligase
VGATAVAEKVDVLLAVGPTAHWIEAGARAAGWSGEFLQTVASPEEALPILQAHLQDQDVVLVKGSRFMKLERIIQALFEDRETL